MRDSNPVLFSVIGLQNSGKTRFVLSILRMLTAHGLRAAVLKHDGHADAANPAGSRRHVLDWEKPGSDTLLSYKSGASMTMVTGGGQSLLHVGKDPEAGDVYALCGRMNRLARESGSPLNVIVVEGFKKSQLAKVFVCRTREHVLWLKENGIDNIRAVIVPENLRELADPSWPMFLETQVADVLRACGVSV